MTAIEPLTTASLVQIARSLRRRQVSPVELVDAYTRRIEAARSLQAFITIPDERTRREAQRAERRLSGGEAGAPLGVTISLKDLFATRALRPAAGSRILRNRWPSSGAAACARAPAP